MARPENLTRRPLRPLRRALHPGDPDGAGGGAGPGLRQAAQAAQVQEAARRPAARLRRPADAALLRPAADRGLGGAQIYLKREDLLHTGAHKINNAIGQALLAQEMGKKRVIAETGAGQHGVATATAAALLGLYCMIYMGEEDMRRQRLNVHRMRLLGAEVVPVDAGAGRSRTRSTRRSGTG